MKKGDLFTLPASPWLKGEKPRYHGQSWTKTEVDGVITAFKRGTSIALIALGFGRTVASIASILHTHDHIRATDSSFKTYVCMVDQPEDECSYTTINEVPMSKKIIETKVIILGQDAASMTDDQIFDLIYGTEKQLETARQIKNQPKKLAAKIKDLEADIQKLVDYVDGR